ncbi:hypothetical protein QN277_020718 [Acacia crassicarpa]|uniref:Uncharacterized protein n=1 Tax=Acacia crassicarpa TaxID=499986 RepID=A0AAE1MNL7_9FABA|nr:hypothetical protein QN277_020718 [Acacia crassicarpa]
MRFFCRCKLKKRQFRIYQIYAKKRRQCATNKSNSLNRRYLIFRSGLHQLSSWNCCVLLVMIENLRL